MVALKHFLARRSGSNCMNKIARLACCLAGAAALMTGPAHSDGRHERPDRDEIVAQVKRAIAAAAATRGPGSPAIWTMSDADTTVHLVGTVHILKPETVWRSAALDAAIARADTIYLEADTSRAQDPAAMAPLLRKYAVFPEGNSLTALLDDEDEAIVAAATAKLGVPIQALDGFKPWMVAVQLTALQLARAGYDINTGVEVRLTADGKAAAKQFGYFETLEEQFAFLSSAPLDEQVDFLVVTAETGEVGGTLVDAMVAEWSDGDIAGLAGIVANPELLGGADVYETLIVGRNRNWAPRIEALLDAPGVKLVAVGAAHLVGPDSVISLLEARGHAVTLAH